MQLPTASRLVVAATFVAGAALAQSPLPLGAMFPVNSATAANQSGPHIGVAPDGSFRVAWSSFVNQPREIVTRQVDAAGTPLGNDVFLNTFTTGNQDAPALAMNASGDWVGAWISTDQFGPSSDADAIARFTTANGTVLQAEFLAQDDSVGDPDRVVVARHADDSFVVVRLQDESLVAHRYGSAGASLGDDETVGFDTNVGTIDVAALPAGRSVVVFDASSLPTTDIVGRFVESDGSGSGFPFPIDGDGPGADTGAHVAADARGGFVVAWNDAEGDIVARRFRADGTAVGGILLVEAAAGQITGAPDVAMAEDGGFVVTWSRGADFESEGVFAREYSRTGSPATSVFVVSTAAGDHETPSVGIGLRRYVFAWQGPDAEADGIFARRFERRVVFGDSFESGDLDYWSSVAP
jgi:hypothetical protein